MPANRSSSGVGASTWLTTSSKSSVGQTFCLELARDREPEAVRVDLGGVREQRLVAHPEVVARTAPGW